MEIGRAFQNFLAVGIGDPDSTVTIEERVELLKTSGLAAASSKTDHRFTARVFEDERRDLTGELGLLLFRSPWV
jgi:hypothetical protein